jgi:DNA-directed RNA polymerase subunit RPC12/RpoP
MVFRPVVAVVMLESWVARCVHCEKEVAVPQHVSGVFTPIIRRSDCVSLSMVFRPVVDVVLESWVVRCVHCATASNTVPGGGPIRCKTCRSLFTAFKCILRDVIG